MLYCHKRGFFCRMVEGMWPLFEFYKEEPPRVFRLYSAACFGFVKAEDGSQLQTLELPLSSYISYSA